MEQTQLIDRVTRAPFRDAGRLRMWFAQLTAMAISQLRPADHFMLQRACFGLFQKLLGGCPSHLLGDFEPLGEDQEQAWSEGRLGELGKGENHSALTLKKPLQPSHVRTP